MHPQRLPLALRLPIATIAATVGLLAIGGVISEWFTLVWVVGMFVVWLFG